MRVALSSRAVNQLGRNGIHTVGELLALSDAQVRSLNSIGEKTASDILTFQAARP